MATHVVSWGRIDHVISSAPSSAPSILSVDAILSDMHEKAPDVHRTSRTTDPQINLLGFPTNAPFGYPTLTSTNKYPGTGDAFTRHHKYFFSDGNVTFLVDGVLYCVHRYHFSRDSVYFSTRFNQLDTRDHEALLTIISLDDITRKDFDAFLSILYPENYQETDLSYEEWESVLRLSTHWDFTSLRELASSVVNPTTSHSGSRLGRTYSVKDSIVPALSALCGRNAPISLNEALEMKIEDLILVMTVREGIRNQAIQAYAAEIPRRPAEEKPAERPSREEDSHIRPNASTSRGGSHNDSDTEACPRPEGWPVGSSGVPAHQPHSNRLPAMTRTTNQSGSGRYRTSTKSDTNDFKSIVNNAGSATPVSTMGSFKRPISQLGISANHHVAPSISHNGSGVHGGSPDFFNPRAKALLNKLTAERFDAISDQIISFVNRSEMEKDGRTLTQVIKHILEKATEDDTFPEICARLCCKMVAQISPQIQDERIKDAEGKPTAGGQLFRKSLLNCCQEDFEREWGAEETTAVAATKTTKFQAVEEANRRTKGGEESELHLDKCYAEVKAKRRRVSVVHFIAEIFKVGILPERIVHRCIRGFLDNPEEAAIEGLCKLLTTVGSLLDTETYRVHLDMDFLRMQELTKNKNISSRMVFMLRDVIELRELEWVPRTATAAPTTIADVHQEAAAKAEEESYMQQNAGMSHGSLGGGDRDAVESSQPEGSVADTGSPSRQQGKAGDLRLSQFGKIGMVATPMSFGHGDPPANERGADPNSRDSTTITRTSLISPNMTSMSQNPDAVVEPSSSKGSRPPSREPSVDLDTGAQSEPASPQQKLQLLPWPKPVGEESTFAESEAGSDDAAEEKTGALAPTVMSEPEARAKINGDTKEFPGAP